MDEHAGPFAGEFRPSTRHFKCSAHVPCPRSFALCSGAVHTHPLGQLASLTLECFGGQAHSNPSFGEDTIGLDISPLAQVSFHCGRAIRVLTSRFRKRVLGRGAVEGLC